MRNISCALTKQPMIDGTKTVTRRLGWKFLKVGDFLQPVEKCMGLKKGEKPVKLCSPIRVTGITRESLRMMTDYGKYGRAECIREGFPNMTPREFVDMFCASHKGCAPNTVITRIEFEHTEVAQS